MQTNHEQPTFFEAHKRELSWGALVILAGLLGVAGVTYFGKDGKNVPAKKGAIPHTYDKLTSQERLAILLLKQKHELTSSERLMVLLGKLLLPGTNTV